MNITRRTCANCAAFNPSLANGGPVCLQLVTIAESDEARPRVKRQPQSTDYCGKHMTGDELRRYGQSA